MTFTLDESSKNPIPLRWKGKDKNHHEHESAKKVIIYYEKLTDSITKKLNEKQSEIADLWLTLKKVQAICKLHEETGIDANTLKQIVFLTQRH